MEIKKEEQYSNSCESWFSHIAFATCLHSIYSSDSTSMFDKHSLSTFVHRNVWCALGTMYFWKCLCSVQYKCRKYNSTINAGANTSKSTWNDNALECD